MGRIPRWRLGHGVYHVINRSLDRKWTLQDDADKHRFMELLIRQRAKYDINVYNWAIMSNHFHLAIEVLRPEDMSAYVGKVCELYTRYHNKKYDGCGPLWQGRFKSILVQKNSYMSKLGRYIELNPVRAEMVGKAWDYPWSSARHYVGLDGDPLTDGDRNWFYESLGATAEARSERYQQYLTIENEAQKDAALFRSGDRIVGDEQFAANWALLAGRATARKTGRPRRPAA